MFLFGSEQNYSLDQPSGILDAVWMTPAGDSRHSLLE
jgi:hypothetical protein